MIPLPSAAIVEDARATMSIAHADQAFSDFANRSIPIDFLEGPVGAPAQRRGQPVFSILVVVDTLRFLTRVSMRCDVFAIAADPRDMPAIKLHFDSAIDAAQDASGLMPLVG